ncbi:phosphoribosylformylglycinamidine cyclo-ligase [Candidatus Thorarchaeota archaeon]|nr:MAG: phosphoribosylformylglycinamidine cyclo-ligase [Candidatus Thorarchaeota archaeon]
MPKGVPVATVGIDNGQNAAYLAARILSIAYNEKEIPQTYAEAGIDEELVSKGLEKLGEYVRESFKHGQVMQDFGHYANTVQISDNLCLALSTDGVGSKVLIAEEAGRFDTIGIDCVAMNVNDLICIGAKPVGFVDYLASERPLPEKVIDQIGKGLLQGCTESEIPILGGETAILPDMIKGLGGYGLDLAGTAVGIARPDELFDGSSITPGDIIIGIESNGIHSNGFTLARKVLQSKYKITDILPWGISLGDELLRPTKIYVSHFKALREEGVTIKGLAHITGSGFRKIMRLGQFKFLIANLPEIHPIFEVIRTAGNIEWKEMFTTFNMGIGLVVVVPPEEADKAIEILSKQDRTYKLGSIQSTSSGRVEIPEYGVVIE